METVLCRHRALRAATTAGASIGPHGRVIRGLSWVFVERRAKEASHRANGPRQKRLPRETPQRLPRESRLRKAHHRADPERADPERLPTEPPQRVAAPELRDTPEKRAKGVPRKFSQKSFPRKLSGPSPRLRYGQAKRERGVLLFAATAPAPKVIGAEKGKA